MLVELDMSKTKLRKIFVLNHTFLWKVEHYHLKAFQYSECVDKIVIYLQEYKNSPIIFHFKLEDNFLYSEEENWFMDSGCIINKSKSINLNRPAVISELIKSYFGKSWKPKETSRSFEIGDALKLLSLLDLPNEKS